MRIRLFLAAAAGLLVAARAPTPGPAAVERARLQGAWKAVEEEVDGVLVHEDVFKGERLLIKGRRFTILGPKGGPAELQATFRVDPSREPRTIDLTVSEGPLRGTLLGIYKLKGNRLEVCIAAPGKARPAGLWTTFGSGHDLRVYERERP